MLESKAGGGEGAQRTFSTLANFDDDQQSSRAKDDSLNTSLDLIFFDDRDDEFLRRIQRTKVQMGIVFFDQPQRYFKFLF